MEHQLPSLLPLEVDLEGTHLCTFLIAASVLLSLPSFDGPASFSTYLPLSSLSLSPFFSSFFLLSQMNQAAVNCCLICESLGRPQG